MRVGEQIAEAYRTHQKVSHAEARRRALEMLKAVRIRDPERVARAYPHEVSGGMGQRIMIAMMLIPDRSEEHTSELQSLMRISYAVFCLHKKTNINVKPQIQLTI